MQQTQDFERHTRRLARRLRPHLQRPLTLTLTSNRDTVVNVRRESDHLYVRLHHLFLLAPTWVMRALGAYLERADREASRELGLFIGSAADTKHHHHDLATIVRVLNRRYFRPRLRLRAIWDQRCTFRPGTRPRLASFRVESRTIVLSRLLDRSSVPRYVIEGFVFHEMLHCRHRVRTYNGRRVFHSSEFRADERRFKDRKRATAWLRRHLQELFPF